MGMGRLYNQVNDQVLGAVQQQWQQELANAARQPIPGFTGPAGNGAGIPGLLPGGPPPPQQLPQPQMQPSTFMSSGPYGNQAMRMAGLLAPPASPTYPAGLLGGGKGGPFRPGGK